MIGRGPAQSPRPASTTRILRLSSGAVESPESGVAVTGYAPGSRRTHTNAAIAVELGLYPDAVRKRRGRFDRGGIDALADAPRSGRPSIYAAADVAAVTAWACEITANHDIPIARWSTPERAGRAAADGITPSVSMVRRWLADHAITPWQ